MVLGGWDVSYERCTPVLPPVVIVIAVEALRILAKVIGVSVKQVFAYARPFVGVFQKSIPDRFVNFWRLFPTKWLQNRPQIPKPSPEIPPHRALCGVGGGGEDQEVAPGV